MPTPLEILLDPISLTVLALYAGLMLWEALAPGRELPRVRGWRTRGLLHFAVFFFLSSYLPLLWDGLLARHRWFDLTALGTLGGAAVGLAVYELGAWAYHRTLHAWTPGWRVHQTHHSAERLDTFGAFLFHPLDMIGWTAVSSLALVYVVGVTPGAATALLLTITWLGIFQHANLRTPHWLGYFVQRPESHTVHHATGVHARNYADLPIVDLLFGTFENPRGFEHETGLYPGGSSRTLDLLLLRDVSAPAALVSEHGREVAPDSRPAMGAS